MLCKLCSILVVCVALFVTVLATVVAFAIREIEDL